MSQDRPDMGIDPLCTCTRVHTGDRASSFFEMIQSVAVDEREACRREYRHRPIESRDPPRGTQFGLKEAHINLLRAVIIQGTGRQEFYTAGPK